MTPPPIPRDALAMPLTPSPESVGLGPSVSSPSEADDLSDQGYVEASTFPAGEPPRSLGGSGIRDRSQASGSVPVIENASAGAEMRLAALGADARIDSSLETAPDVEQQARDEVMVDDLLRRATEQMLIRPDEPDGEGSPAAEVPVVESRSRPAVPGAPPPLPAEAVPEHDAMPAPAAPPDEASSLAASDLHEIVADEPVIELHPPSSSHLSPLAQTLAHMAEALHGEVVGDGGLEIDIVDGPLVSVTRQPPVPSVAIPPPLPSAAVLAASASAASAAPESAGVVSPVPEALAERPRVPRRSKAWYEEVFDENYLRTLPFMTAEQTLR
jgi:hypothetical protein